MSEVNRSWCHLNTSHTTAPPAWTECGLSNHTLKHTQQHFLKLENYSRIYCLRGLYLKEAGNKTRENYWFVERKFGSNGSCCSNLSYMWLCVAYCMFTHTTLSVLLCLSLLVPTMPQFDPGSGGIISNRQRIGQEVRDCVCQRRQVRFTETRSLFIDTHICLCLSRTHIISLLIETTKPPSVVLLFGASFPSRSEESFKQYFSEMPWLAVPYPDEARRSRLNRLYGIQGTVQPLPPDTCGQSRFI